MGVSRVIQWLFKKGMAVYRLEERFQSIDARFDQLDKRFERLENRVEHVKATLADHTRRLDRLEIKFDASLEMRERVAVLEALLGRRPA